jgi:hypothetical protein
MAKPSVTDTMIKAGRVKNAQQSLRECDLYEPIRDALTAQGFQVRGEVKDCDIAAVRGDELVIVEMKRSFSTALLVQATRRQRITDAVYVALPKPPAKERRAKWRGIEHLLRRLELGLIFVSHKKAEAQVEVIFHPLPFERKHSAGRKKGILREISGRSGDHNQGGITRRQILTAYRENAIFIACCLQKFGPLAPKQIRALGGGAKTQSILGSNFYGWFERIETGIYGLKPQGKEALKEFRVLVTKFKRQLAKKSVCL